jgi:hypothetical protein
MLFGPKWLHGYQTGGRLAECPNTESPCELVGTLAVPAASAKSNAVEIAAVSKFFHGALGELDLFHGDLPEGLSSLP